MKHLLRSVLALVVTLAIFYNLERLDFGEQNVIDLASMVYVLGLAAVLLTIVSSRFRSIRASMIVVSWLVIYLLVKILHWRLAAGNPVIGGVYTYLTITEIVMLTVIIWLAHQVGSAIHEFEEAVKRVTLGTANTKRILQLDEADEEIQIEMFRSRHHHHPLSVIIVEPKTETIQASLHHLVQDIQETMMSSYVVNSMAQTLGKYLRRTDLILQQLDRGRFIVLCPETTPVDSQLLVEYIQSVTSEQFGVSVASGFASFPNEAITFEELLHKAEFQLKGANSHVQTDTGALPFSEPTEPGELGQADLKEKLLESSRF